MTMRYLDAVTLLESSTDQQLREHRKSVQNLLTQLTRSDVQISNDGFLSTLRDTHNRFSFVLADEFVIGMGQVIIEQKLTDWRIRLEDLIVDTKYQGKGIGRTILCHLHRQVEEVKLNSGRPIEWTFNNSPARQNAEFYIRLGCIRKDTQPFKVKHETLGENLQQS